MSKVLFHEDLKDQDNRRTGLYSTRAEWFGRFPQYKKMTHILITPH